MDPAISTIATSKEDLTRQAVFLALALSLLTITAVYLINSPPYQSKYPLLFDFHLASLFLSFFMDLLLAWLAVVGAKRFLMRYGIVCLALLPFIFGSRLCLQHPICDQISSIRTPGGIFLAGLAIIIPAPHLYDFVIFCCLFLGAKVYNAFMTKIVGPLKPFVIRIVGALKPFVIKIVGAPRG